MQHMLVVLLLAFYKAATAITTCCENGWIANNGSCYLFRDESTANWLEATRYCAAHHSHLVTIETRDEDMFLRDEGMRLFKNDHDRQHASFWIGATDDDVEGVWKWYTDHSVLQYNSLQPSQVYDADQDCALLWGGFKFDWGDYSCSGHAHFICEKSGQPHQSHIVG